MTDGHNETRGFHFPREFESHSIRELLGAVYGYGKRDGVQARKNQRHGGREMHVIVRNAALPHPLAGHSGFTEIKQVEKHAPQR